MGRALVYSHFIQEVTAPYWTTVQGLILVSDESKVLAPTYNNSYQHGKSSNLGAYMKLKFEIRPQTASFMCCSLCRPTYISQSLCTILQHHDFISEILKVNLHPSNQALYGSYFFSQQKSWSMFLIEPCSYKYCCILNPQTTIFFFFVCVGSWGRAVFKAPLGGGGGAFFDSQPQADNQFSARTQLSPSLRWRGVAQITQAVLGDLPPGLLLCCPENLVVPQSNSGQVQYPGASFLHRLIW